MRGRTGKVYDRGVHNVTSTSLPAGKHQYRGGDNAHSGTGEPLWAFCGHEGWWGRSTARESEHVPESVAFMISDHTAWQGVHGWCTFLHSRSLRSASVRSSESLSALWMQQIAIDTISIRDTLGPPSGNGFNRERSTLLASQLAFEDHINLELTLTELNAEPPPRREPISIMYLAIATRWCPRRHAAEGGMVCQDIGNSHGTTSAAPSGARLHMA